MSQERVELQIKAQKISLDIDTGVYLGLIINELVSNALKYAFSPNKKGKINIDATNTIEFITIYNINGQIVKSINSDSKIISTSNLSDGIYIIELSDVLNNKSTTKVNIY